MSEKPKSPAIPDKKETKDEIEAPDPLYTVSILVVDKDNMYTGSVFGVEHSFPFFPDSEILLNLQNEAVSTHRILNPDADSFAYQMRVARTAHKVKISKFENPKKKKKKDG